MKSKILLLSAFAAVALIMGGCDDDDFDYTEPSAGVSFSTTEVVTHATSVELSTPFTLEKGQRYSKVGFAYSTSPNPTIYGTAVEGEVKDGKVVGTITGLAPNTTYYVRSFVTLYNGDLVYSDQFTVFTAEGTLAEQLENYIAPTYEDNYVDIAGWENRSQWNLANVHDPTVMKADDGYYYMYQTDASYGNASIGAGKGHFHGRRSKDLVNWEYLGSTMDEAPAWVAEKCNEYRAAQGLPAITFTDDSYGYWAPCARNLGNGTYRMYYSIVINHTMATGTLNGDDSWSERGFIGVMETKDPASNVWEDKGFVTVSSTDRGDQWFVVGDYKNAYYTWNAIDPSYIITPEGEHWLIHGSWHSGIVALQLNPETGKPLNELGTPWGTSMSDIASFGQCIYSRTKGYRWQGSEGPEIVYRNGYYYLFLAYDGLDVPYNTRVVRATSITGPYYGIDGTDCTNNGGDAYPIVTHPYKFENSYGWVGISHCAIFNDGNDNWYYASQGRLPEGAYGNTYANAIMMGHVRSIRWTEDGWPVVMPERYGAVPQVAISEDELVGEWEHIDLGYSYGNQKESSRMTLDPDYTISAGTWKGGSWSYDADNQVLTANGVKLYLQRECDWEASPRTHTIVYVGLNGKKTYWGKKVVNQQQDSIPYIFVLVGRCPGLGVPKHRFSVTGA